MGGDKDLVLAGGETLPTQQVDQGRQSPVTRRGEDDEGEPEGGEGQQDEEVDFGERTSKDRLQRTGKAGGAEGLNDAALICYTADWREAERR